MSHSTFAALIQQSGQSMSQIARDSGVSLSHISKIASGDRKPSLPTVVHLAATIGVDRMVLIDAIFGEAKNGKAA